MECGVCHYVGANWLWWVVCVCVYVGWVLLAVQCGSVRVVKGVWILETQKRGPEINPKWWGSRSDLHSTLHPFLLVGLSERGVEDEHKHCKQVCTTLARM